MEGLSESQSSSSHTQGENEGPCLIVQDSQQEEEHPPGTSHKQKMLWEMTALQGDQHISPVLEQVRATTSSSSQKDRGKKKDTEKEKDPKAGTSVVATTAPTTVAPPWTITKMPSVPPRHKESHSSSSSSSMGSVYPVSSHDTSGSSRSTLSSLASSDSSGAGRKPPQGPPRAVSSKAKPKGTGAQGQINVPTSCQEKSADADIPLSQEDMFSDPKAEAKERTRHQFFGTPSETIPCLQLSGQLVYANETSTSEEGSVNVIQPSPEAYGPLPVIIQSTPTPTEEEPMDMSLEDAEDEPQMMPEGELVVGETQHISVNGSQQQQQQQQDEGQQVTEQKKRPRHSEKKRRSAGSEGSEEDEIRIPEWQQALNREEEEAAAAAASGESRTSSRVSVETHSSQRSSPSEQWAQQQSESIAGQNVQQELTTEESARSRPASIKSPVLKAPEKEVPTGAEKKSAESPEKSVKPKDTGVDIIEPSEPQFSQDLFHPEVPMDTGVSATPEEAAETTHKPIDQDNLARRSEVQQDSQAQSQQQDDQDRSEKPPSDDWSLHLTPTQSDTQSQGMYLSGKGPSGHSGKEMHKEQIATRDEPSEHVEHSVHVAETSDKVVNQRSAQLGDKEAVRDGSERRHSEASEAAPRPPGGQSVESQKGSGQWDESIQSAPRQSQSVDPSQLSSIGFHLSVPTDSGLRPVTSVTPPVDKRKKGRASRQPRHSTPLTEESQVKDQADTPTGVKGPQTSTLNLEDGTQSEPQESNDLPRFHLKKPSDTEQLVKTAKESPSKRSTSVFARVQESKAATVPRRTRKQLHRNQGSNGESEDPFALPSSMDRRADSRQQSVTTTGTEREGRPETQQETATAPEQPGTEVEADDPATIPMVYDDLGEASRDVVREKQDKPQEETETEKASRATSQKRGKKTGGKKRKKPNHRSQERQASGNQQQGASSSMDRPTKQPRVERDPYEWTESQSNKTPSPMKQRRGTASDTAGTLTRRRLHEQETDHPAGAIETGDIIDVAVGSATGARKSAGGKDNGKEGQEGPPKDTTPDKGMGQEPSGSPSKQQTPPVRGDGNNADDSQDSERSSQEPPQAGAVVRIVETTTVRTILTMRIVKESTFRDGKLIDVNVHETQDTPVVERQVEESVSPSLGSSNSSLTSGSLADISSISTSKSSGETPSLQKTSSSSSSRSSLTKSSSISSISRADSSLGKTVSSSSPSSNKTSPNTSKGSVTPGSPKMTRSVSFQDEQPRQKSPSRESGDKPAAMSPVSARTAQRPALTKAQTMPSPPTEQRPSEQSSRLTRSSTDVTSPKQGESSSTDKPGRKSIFSKTYSTPGKRGLRVRGSEDVSEKEGRESRHKLPAGETVKDAGKEGEHRKTPQRRQRHLKSTQKSGKKSSTDKPEDQSTPTTLPATLPTEPSVPMQSERSRETTGQSSSLSEVRSSERSKSSEHSKSSERMSTGQSSRGAEILATPPQQQESPGTDVVQQQLRPGTRVIAKWLDNYYYAGKIVEPASDNKYVVSFDDGDTRNIKEKDIIIKEWLSKGQSVLAERDDGYSYAGVVVGYYKDDTGEQGYAVETDNDHATQRYRRDKVILTRDQAASLAVSSSSSGPGSATSSSEINLDNIVSGKRTRSRFVLSPGGSPRGRASNSGNNQGGLEKPPVSPRTPQTGTSRQTAKRKLTPNVSDTRSGTPPPKRGKGIKVAASSDPRISPRRSPRKNPATASTSVPSTSAPREREAEKSREMGPLPTNRSLFKGLAFLITSCSEPKRKRILGRSPSQSTDESGLEEEGETVPLDKTYASEQIQQGGGIVLSNFDKSQVTKCKVYLLSNASARTTKYFQALAAGIPCLSHLWLRDCIKWNKIQDYEGYLLPAGIGLDDKTVLEQQPHRCILAGMHIFLVTKYTDSQKAWRSVLLAAGCEVIKKLPTHMMRKSDPVPLAFECEVIVTDNTCPRPILNKALQLHIPVVSLEWLMQSLINSQRLSYTSSHKFVWNWTDES